MKLTQTVTEVFTDTQFKAEKMKLSKQKTKFTIVSSQKKDKALLMVNNLIFEKVAEFKCFGTTVTNRNKMNVEMDI